MVVHVYVHALKLQPSGSLTFPPRLISSFRILDLTLSFNVPVDVCKYCSGNFLDYVAVHLTMAY